MELSLSENQIGMQGAQYLGEGLQKNKVREKKHPLHLYHIHLPYFIQTLTRLDLSDNQIGAQGTQYLGEGFQKNKVRQNSFFISIIFIFLTSYRHSLYSTFPRIKSVPKVHSILVKYYKRTK